jgi:hypothetical protein
MDQSSLVSVVLVLGMGWEQTNCCSLATCMLKRVFIRVVVCLTTFPERTKREKERPQIFISYQIEIACYYYLYIYVAPAFISGRDQGPTVEGERSCH